MKYDLISIGDAFEDVFVVPEEAKVKHDQSYGSGLSISFELGDKIPLKKVDYEIGGSACNVAVGLARLGIKSSLASVLGDDTPAEKIKNRLASENVDEKNLIIDKNMQTNFSVIFRNDFGRTIFIYHGLKEYSKLRLKKSHQSKWIFLAPTGEKTELLERDILSKISEDNAKLAWNPGSLQIKKGFYAYKNLLKNCSIIFMNREEALDFINFPVRPNDGELMKKIHLLGPKIVVITYGKKGAKAFDGKNFYSVESLDVVRVDSTGAGDSFTSGFLAKIIGEKINLAMPDEETISIALKWGILNSNSVIQYVGAQPGLLNEKQIFSQMNEYKRLRVELN